MRAADDRDSSRGVRIVFAILVICFAVSLLGDDVAAIVGPSGMAIGYTAGAIIMWRRSAEIDRREQVAWRFVASGLGFVATGIFVVGVIDMVSPAGAPAFGVADLFFLTAYMTILTGIALMPQMAGNFNRRVRLFLDAMIGGISVGVLLWLVEIRGLIGANPDAPIFDRIIATSYPIVDLAAFVVVMIVLVRRSEYRFDPRLMLLATAASLQAAADISYLHAIGGSFGDAQPAFPLFLLAVAAFVGTAALVHRRPKPREYADRMTSMIWMMAPYGAAAVMVALLVYEVMMGAFTANAKILLVGTLSVGALVIARQAALIREHRDVVESQRAALVSSISHELRTPLTAMLGFLSLLDDPEVGPTLPEEEQSEMISTVHAQSAYLSRIVHDLVMLARGNLDQMELKRSDIDVAELVTASVASVDTTSHEMVVDVEEGLIANLDRDRVQQVIVNLLSNAQRYGGSRIAVVARDDRSTLRLEVHDDGPGVPKKHELVIWERFERGPNRLNATVPGSGIGLAVVDAIARGHGGEAGYEESPLLGGACFSITLPDAVVTEPASAPHAALRPAS
jgi:signal transduction histidine kinase